MSPSRPNRGKPTPAIALEGDESRMVARLGAAGTPHRVEVDDSLLERLGGVCGDVSRDGIAVVESARDWWPLGMIWALEGTLPARAAAVARPRTAEEVSGVLAVCQEAVVPVTTTAGRSGVCGASVPIHGGVVLDLCGLSGVVDVDDSSLVLDVRPGTFGDVLEDSLRTEHGLTLGHWPQSMSLSTVGGWIACRSAGQLSTRYGKIEDMVTGLEVALADGRRIRTGGAPRAAVGPDLTQVFVGSEGTLGVITEAWLRLHPAPGAGSGGTGPGATAEGRAAYGFSSFGEGLDACRRILRRGATPAVLRLYDQAESARNFEVGDHHVLLVLDEGDTGLVDAVMAVVAEECSRPGGPSSRKEAVPLDPALVARWLEHRNDVSALEALIRRGLVVDTIEVAARWAALPSIYSEVLEALGRVEHLLVASAHESHAYPDGACLYFTFAGNPPEEVSSSGGGGFAGREAFYIDAWDAATRAVLAHGGALSHHHGVGLNRARFVADALGPAHGVLVALKSALDPTGILNPGKLGLPDPFGGPTWP
ncbi:MAG: FAD-binding oxidoreductase [Acidimicrobiales bacterium]